MSMYIFSIDMIYILLYILFTCRRKKSYFRYAYVTSRAGYAKISPSYAMVIMRPKLYFVSISNTIRKKLEEAYSRCHPLTNSISIGNYTVREVLMKNRTRVWRNVYNTASA